MKTIKTYLKKYTEATRRTKRLIFGTLAVLILISIFAFIKIYKAIIYPNVMIANQDEFSLYIYSDYDFEDVKHILYKENKQIKYKQEQPLSQF